MRGSERNDLAHGDCKTSAASMKLHCVTLVSVPPFESSAILRSDSSTSGNPAWLANLSSINKSSVSESKSRDNGKGSCAHNKVPMRMRCMGCMGCSSRDGKRKGADDRLGAGDGGGMGC